MLAQPISPAAQTGEEQSSIGAMPDVFAARDAHWKLAAIGLLSAARTLCNTYLKDERDDEAVCIDADHHGAVRDLFARIKQAEDVGLSIVGAAQLAAAGHVKVDLWSALVTPFSASTLADLIEQCDWLRPGDAVFRAETLHRHTLTEADFKAADAQGEIGGAA